MTKCACVISSYNFFQLYFVIQQFEKKLKMLDKLYITLNSESLNTSFKRCVLFDKKFENIKKLCNSFCNSEKIKVVDEENSNFFSSPHEQYKTETEVRSNGYRIVISHAEEDLVLLLHDDVFYKKPDFVNFLFSKVEHDGYDISGLVGEHTNLNFDLANGKFKPAKSIGFASHNMVVKKHILQKTDGNFYAFNLKSGCRFPYTDVFNTTEKTISYEGFCIFSVQLYKHAKNIYVHEYDGYKCNNQIQHYKEQELDLDFINISGGSGHLDFNLNPDVWIKNLKLEMESENKNIKLFEKNLAFSKIIMDRFPYDLIKKYDLVNLYDELQTNLQFNIETLKSYDSSLNLNKYNILLQGYL